MNLPAHAPTPWPDQADGLRRLFAASRMQFIAVAANPDVAFAGLALERLARALDDGQRPVLVVDAARGAPQEMAALDLAACIERIDERLSYLAARGLPMRCVDARGSCASFLDALVDAMPEAGAVIVHAPSAELGRIFAQRTVRALLVAADHPGSVTSAYADLKLLAQRFGMVAFDLLLLAAAHSPRTPRIAEHFALTADRFTGAALHDWAAIDPAAPAELPPGLLRLARGLALAASSPPAAAASPAAALERAR
jgi:flagellar biosynthesis protein FlhG